MLEKIRKAKMAELVELAEQEKEGALHTYWPHPRVDFTAALTGDGDLPAVIAEYKRASPSRGLICDKVPVGEAVRQYALNGAKAISILTEENWFKGQLAYIEQAHTVTAGQQALPLLRKDFIFDPLQVRATAQTPASAFLLIVQLTPDARLLRELRETGERFGLAAVVEVLDAQDLAIARESGAQIIQVNARNLNTLKVDRQECLRLIRNNPPLAHEKWIAASGISSPWHLREAHEAGFDAVLVGSSLMENGTPGLALHKLLAGENAD